MQQCMFQRRTVIDGVSQFYTHIALSIVDYPQFLAETGTILVQCA